MYIVYCIYLCIHIIYVYNCIQAPSQYSYILASLEQQPLMQTWSDKFEYYAPSIHQADVFLDIPWEEDGGICGGRNLPLDSVMALNV